MTENIVTVKAGNDPERIMPDNLETLKYVEKLSFATSVTVTFTSGAVWQFNCGECLKIIADDSGSLSLPYALLGIAGYAIYFMISHGVFQALTALQAGR